MAKFTDDKGREWDIRLDGPMVKRINEQFKLKLTDLRSNVFMQLAMDPVLLVDVIHATCEAQCKSKDVSPVEFGESLGGSIDAAASALEVAVTDFFPQQTRSLLKSQFEKMKRMQENAMTKAMESVSEQEMEEVVTRSVQREMRKLLASIDSGLLEEPKSATSSTDST